ncbi:MAG: YicC family protein [Bacteriovoracia bacterium]
MQANKTSGSSNHFNSMTGFSDVRAKLGLSYWNCQIRSLNHRFLETKIRISAANSFEIENTIRKKISENFKRGVFEVFLFAEKDGSENLKKINTKQIESYYSDLEGFEKQIKKNISPEVIFRLPGAVTDSKESDGLEAKDVLSQLVMPAIEQLKLDRNREGLNLKNHLLDLLVDFRKHFNEVLKLEPPELERLRNSVAERVKATLDLLNNQAKTEVFEKRMQEEIAFYLERRNFEEEKTRLQMHLTLFEDLLEAKEPVGRKLEFLQQELLRETNTLGTKAQSQPIVSHIIEMKTLLEKIREQLANVE